MERLLCGLQGFIKWDVSVAMENEVTGSSLGSVDECGMDGTGSMVGILDNDVA